MLVRRYVVGTLFGLSKSLLRLDLASCEPGAPTFEVDAHSKEERREEDDVMLFVIFRKRYLMWCAWFSIYLSILSSYLIRL